MQTFYPRFSFILFILMILLYGGALYCLWITPIFIGLKLTIAIILIINFIWMIRKHLLLTANQSVIAVGFAQQTWNCCLNSGETSPVIISPSSIVTRYIIILNLKTYLTNHHFTLLLFPDSLTFESLRQLRVQLYLSLK